jgi:hypothetical protein
LNSETESRRAGLCIGCSFSEEKENHQLFSDTVQLEDGKHSEKWKIERFLTQRIETNLCDETDP